MNRRQEKTVSVVVITILLSLIVWIAFGRELFTKTQILVEKKDELFPDMLQKEWVDKFIWGLDLSGAIIFFSLIIGIFFYFRFRDKKKLN
jgi:hypothetical protein